MLFWVRIKRPCGRLRVREEKAVFPLSKAKITLYEAKWRTPCCKDLKYVDSRVTSEEGEFDFGLVGDGRYWLAIDRQGKSLQLPIDIDAKHDWDGRCEKQGPVIERETVDWIGGAVASIE